MKKIFAFLFTVALMCSAILSVHADELTTTESVTNSLEHYAYMDLASADAKTKLAIINARKEIIYSTSWVADGCYGYVVDETGEVIEIVPTFSEIFPRDWEIPQCVADIDYIPIEVAPYSWEQSYYGNVTLSSAYTEFHTVSVRFAGYLVKTISTVGYNTINGTYNIQYYDTENDYALGNKTGMESGDSFNIDPPEDAKVSIRVSSSDNRYSWNMQVAVDRVYE